jgi:hypothetical protein
MDKITKIVDALNTVDDSWLNQGGRVGLYFEKGGSNHVVVFAGLTETDTDEFETRLGTHHVHVTETIRRINQTHVMSVVPTQAQKINEAKISMASASGIFDEFASKAKQNRAAIARKFCASLDVAMGEIELDVAWNVVSFDRVMTFYSDCLAPKNYSTGPSYTFVEYGDVSEFEIFSRVESGLLDSTQQAIPCVHRASGETHEPDPRFVGNVQKFVKIDVAPFQKYGLTSTRSMVPLGVRCSQKTYDQIGADEIESQFGPA